MRKPFYYILVLLLANFNVYTQSSEEEITPAMVYQLTIKARGEIDLIRQKLDKPVYDPTLFMVENVSPREVYYQARTLNKNCGFLKFQVTQQLQVASEFPVGELTPGHVYAVVEKSIIELEIVKAALGISNTTPLSPLDRTKQPTNVFKSIVQANRQLGAMLDEQMSPDNVFEQVTQSMAYIGAIYMSIENMRMLPEPEFIDGKLPKDVYAELLTGLGIMTDISHKLDFSIAEVREITRDDIKPRDVYDLASLALSESIFLYRVIGCRIPAARSVFPGNKTPSHVFQRVRYLNLYLEAILEQLNNDVVIKTDY